MDTQCGHTFCFKCINDWINNNTNDRQCPANSPECHQNSGNKRKRNITNRDNSHLFTKTNQKYINLLEKLKLNRNLAHKGCDEVMTLRSLSRHLEECNYN